MPPPAPSASKSNEDAVPPASPLAGKLAFFRQSGWMVLAATISGVLMYAVHKLASTMPKAEYGVFTTLLQVLNQMAIPAAGLQLTFVQQAVAATSDEEHRRLTGAMRSLLGGTFVLWLVLAAAALFSSGFLMNKYQIVNPAALWVTLLLGLASFWSPIVLGVLQGRQNFLWLGWANMLNGLTRLGAVAVIVVGLGGCAAGGMTGALLGMLVAMGIAVWQTWNLWHGPAEPFDWWPWLKRMFPMTAGFGAVTFMLTQDMLTVQEFFPAEETGYYGAAGMIGRALYFFTAPVAAVLFPKLVHSAVRAEKSSVLAQALGATALLGGAAALFCTFLPELPLRIIYDPSYLKIAPLVPLFAWCILPLILAGVLVNNLLARERYAAVPFLVAVAVGYVFALNHVGAKHGPSGVEGFAMVIKTLGLFSSLLLVVCLFFTWWDGRSGKTAMPAL